jgi:hypothetical protein
MTVSGSRARRRLFGRTYGEAEKIQRCGLRSRGVGTGGEALARARRPVVLVDFDTVAETYQPPLLR